MKNINQKIKINRKSPKKFTTANKFKCEIINNNEKKEVEAEKNVKISSNTIIRNDSQVQTEKKKMKIKRKRESFYEKCAKSRKEKGMVLLPQKIETKIYKLKKALRKKGLDDGEIRDIIRKKRREEENKIDKEMKHLCYQCRQPGHTLANCPQAGNEDSVDICYFCGSSEHKLSDCGKYKSASKKKEQTLPYAKCFICNKKGHLTSKCKDNEKGVFPKGGKCIICGSIDHMVKDCARNKDKDKPEEEINLKTYNDLSYSVDADDFEMSYQSKNNNKTKKVVKF